MAEKVLRNVETRVVKSLKFIASSKHCPLDLKISIGVLTGNVRFDD